MRYWEFLIQQEGDVAWLPLESRTTEILEGRYRVIARSDRPHTSVEIAIAYDSPDSEASPPRLQKRSKQTDARGVAIVLPYTEFKAGTWTLGCSGQGSENESDWQYAVQLRVLPKEIAPIEETPEPEVTPPELPLSYQLQLERDDYSLDRTETELTLSGQIRATTSDPLTGLHLRIRLRNPETGQLVALVQRILPPQTSPFDFSYSVSLPPKRRTRLILGEIVLCDMKPTVLAARSFTVMATLEGLLDAVDESTQQAAIDAEEITPIEARSAFEMPATAVNPAIAPWRATSLSANQAKSLPPLLQNLVSRQGRDRGLDLPFASDRPQPDAPLQNPLPAADSPAADTLAAETSSSATPLADSGNSNGSSPVNFASSGLYPNDRLTSRLSHMAKDEELSEWFSGDSIEGSQNPFALESDKRYAQSSQSSIVDWDTDEIVLDDDLPLAVRSGKLVPPEIPQTLQLPPDQPVPAPELLVPKGKLTSGRSISMRVKLPHLQPRIFVKLWVYDRQNQTFLAGPLWLTDFLPAEPGRVEIITPLAIPHGALDIQVEAISVEMQTQRESRKVTVTREVVPAAPPVLPLDRETSAVSVNPQAGTQIESIS
ncbi:MAG: hypothetical protein SWY16_08115 [Cyanobacteriota bacterium]|nr:hypothetical protein [Cyanobacteriota bacterium]